MKHLLWILGLIFLIVLPFGCESYQNNSQDQKQQQEEAEQSNHDVLPKGGNNMRR